MDKKGGFGRKEIPVTYVSRPLKPTDMWNPKVQDELSVELEKAQWKQAGSFIEGKTERWSFKAFEMGMDKNRSCEVMATGQNVVIRLPPHLAEKGLKLAKERAVA